MALAFQKNINEDGTTVAISPAEAAGMPEDWIAARKRDDRQLRAGHGLPDDRALP